jgi:hypothetical protein
MIENTIMMSVILLFLAAKKKPVFGQMTLTGDLAVDWVKSGIENVIEASKIEFGSALAFSDLYNIPEYHKDKKVIALIYPANSWANPLMVTQQSILKPLEAMCAVWETEKAIASTFKANGGTCGRIEFTENCPTIKMHKKKSAPQFAPYEVTFE